MRGGPRRLPHDETTAADARRRMALARHRRTTARDQQIAEPLWQYHAIWQMVEATRLRNRRPRPFDIAGNVLLKRPGIDADGVLEARAAQHIFAAELIGADDPPRLANAELRRRIDDIGLREARHARAQETHECLRLPT